MNNAAFCRLLCLCLVRFCGLPLVAPPKAILGPIQDVHKEHVCRRELWPEEERTIAAARKKFRP